MVTATASVAPRPPAASWDEAGPGESPAAVRGRSRGQGGRNLEGRGASRGHQSSAHEISLRIEVPQPL